MHVWGGIDCSFPLLRADDEDFTTGADGTRPAWFWTGPSPSPGTAGIQADGKITSLRMPELSASRQEVLEYFDNSWLLTEIIFSGLQGTEAYYRPPYHNLRHPMIFYYGHPASLYVNKLRVAGLLQEPVNAYFEHILETGVDEMGWDDLSKNDMIWPQVRVQPFAADFFSQCIICCALYAVSCFPYLSLF
jgi:hypothetical protein